MATVKCPLCESPCIIKIIATDDERWCKVDVCSMCGTMYPKGRSVVKVGNAGPRPRTKSGKATSKKTKK